MNSSFKRVSNNPYLLIRTLGKLIFHQIKHRTNRTVLIIISKNIIDQLPLKSAKNTLSSLTAITIAMSKISIYLLHNIIIERLVSVALHFSHFNFPGGYIK